ncbi:hypothetical protein EIN_074330 [Entamoeba invadens IP1]|uniref:XPG N-terminal domain-containing protein n=1 Tax=Entamoeba invadens IP1 TaxID=370355 RepID=A0A0A1UBI5_ENTIV|nr:hypothetical protein EIN_074330 [Entamoeba invadens IP1]ELP92590.1 hypothetical protein EIN_074330 [Entamoeba invadens IP1]|eukprot:XP_004259361.1 hypothetical protein EIN_074330 [Entamoeba invadens IP1]
MGIPHLMKYAESLTKGFPLFSIADKYYTRSHKKTEIIVDGSGFMFQIISECKNDLNELDKYIKGMADVLKLHHISLIFVFDGMTQVIKKAESIERLKSQARETRSFFDKPNSLSDLRVTIFSGFKRVLKHLLLKHGFECIRSVSEADPVIVRLSIEREAYAVVTSDSDFLVSNIRNLFTHISFVKTMTRVISRKNLDHSRVFFRGISIFDVANFLNICPEHIPMFCCVCGNDFTTAFARTLRTKLGLPDEKNVIESVVKKFRRFDEDKDVLGMISERLNENTLEGLRRALVQTERMLECNDKYEQEERERIPLKKEKFPNCAYSMSIILGAFSVSVRPSSKCDPKEDSAACVCRNIRKAIYETFLPVGTVVEEYYDTKKNDLNAPFKVKTAKKMENITLNEYLKEFGFKEEEVGFVNKSFEKGVDLWKIIFFIAVKYIEINGKPKDFAFLVAEWYQLCLTYNKMKQVLYVKGTDDHRTPLSLFSFFHEVVYELMEVVIDNCELKEDFIEQFFFPNVHQFTTDYIQKIGKVPEMVQMNVEKDPLFGEMLGHVDIF